MHSTQKEKQERPRVGLALGGAAARSVYYIGVIESLTANNVPIDFVSASSSGSIIASAYACGTMEYLKETVFSMDRGTLIALLDRKGSKGGIYSLDRVEESLRVLTQGKRFEDTKPLMAFVAADIEQGESVVLSMGDIAHAARISCTVPGLFEPVQWGGKTLVDGGLLNTIPADIARESGMDVVIGVTTRSTKHIFKPNHMRLRQTYKLLKKIFLINHAESLWDRISTALTPSDIADYYEEIASLEKKIEYPGLFTVLGRCIDLAIEANKRSENIDVYASCDTVITLESKRFGIADFSRTVELYKRGLEDGERFVPKIYEIINRASAR